MFGGGTLVSSGQGGIQPRHQWPHVPQGMTGAGRLKIVIANHFSRIKGGVYIILLGM
jgi:hypothetical protein